MSGQDSRKAPSSSEEGVGGGGPTREVLLSRAAEMRRNPTEAERRLWMALRNSQLSGEKFRRQAIIGNRIVDFFCPAKGLIVEIDGETHDPEQDRLRDARMLERHGFRTLRFTNLQVLTEQDGVLASIDMALASTPERWNRADPTTPQPPPLKRRGSIAPTIAAALRAAAERLAGTSDTARLDAEVLMAHALGVSRSDVLLRHMGDESPTRFDALVERRALHEPVAYITGTQEFYGRTFQVTSDVLIPRPDSESVVEAALEAAPAAGRFLDCGVGSGALLLTLMAERPGAEGVGIDRSEGALAVAAANARQLSLTPWLERRDWTQPGWSEELGRFSLVIANPPYVETGADLDPDVTRWEPAGALFAGADGLDDYRSLVPQLPALLAHGGAAVLEIGAAQADAVSEIARAAGFSAELRRDLGGRPRALILRLGLGNAIVTH